MTESNNANLDLTPAEGPGTITEENSAYDATASPPDTDDSRARSVPDTDEDTHEMPQLLDAVKGLSDLVSELASRVESKIFDDSIRDTTIDQLHAELQEYRRDLLSRLTKPLIMDMIALHDNLGKEAEYSKRRSSESFDSGDTSMASALEGYRLEVEDILARQGVVPFTTPGDDFDGKRQRALKVLPAPSDDLAHKVYERVRYGFESDSQVDLQNPAIALVRRELVNVYGSFDDNADPKEADIG